MSDHRHAPRDLAAEPCCPDCCNCATALSFADHLEACGACRGHSPCELGLALVAEEEADAAT